MNCVQEILDGDCADTHETFEISYAGGMKLDVRKSLIHMDDHQYEALLLDRFGFLIPINSHAGDLLKHVCAAVLPDNPGLLPNDLMDTFGTLLNLTIDQG